MSEVDQGPALDDFRAWLNQVVQVAVADLTLPMTLTVAREIAGSPRPAGGFQLEFLGPVDPVLTQNLMRIVGPGAAYDIFMVPVARDASGTRYAATFF